MKEPGYIYIMVNPSLEGLVKIGKTTRDPESRAKELSQATGVPTSFYAAFSIYVSDCHAAEEYVHAVLDHNGFRHTENREFFQMSLRQAIEVLVLVEKELGRVVQEVGQSPLEPEATFSDEQLSGEIESEEHPGRAIYEHAINVYCGYGDELQDEEEGVRLLERAKALNFPAAFTAHACHFWAKAQESEDRFTRTEASKAWKLVTNGMAVLKEGADRGHGRCWVMLAQLYGLGRLMQLLESDRESACKCWKKYFRSETFLKDDDTKWTLGCYGEIFGLAPPGVASGRARADYIRDYLREVRNDTLPLDMEIAQLIKPFKSEVIEALTQSISFRESPDRERTEDDAKFIEDAREQIAFVQHVL